MQDNETSATYEKKLKKRRFNWEIYYFEKVGSRHVLRFGHMFWVLIAIALIGVMIAIFVGPIK